MTPCQAMTILYYLATQATARATKKGVDMIATIVLSVVKRGTVTTKFVEKIVNGLPVKNNHT